MAQVSTAGRLLEDIARESAALYGVVTNGAGLDEDRARGARAGELRLTLAEQLRLAEATTVFARDFARDAVKLRAQALAARSFETGDSVARHNEAPAERWERSTQLWR